MLESTIFEGSVQALREAHQGGRAVKLIILAGVFLVAFTGPLLAQSAADFEVVWERTYGGGKVDGASAVTVLPGGDIVVAGDTESKGAGHDVLWVTQTWEHCAPPQAELYNLRGFLR